MIETVTGDTATEPRGSGEPLGPTDQVIPGQLAAHARPKGRQYGSLRDIPWRRVGIEFVAIFTAVLLSFIAEDWRQDLGERRVEQRLLTGLSEDLRVDERFFGATVSLDSLALLSGEWLQANWRRPDPPLDSVNWALNGMYRGMAYAPARTEYEAARNSARLDLIRSPELRRMINTHYEQTHGILEDVWAMNLRFHFEWVAAVAPYVEFAPKFRQPIGELSEYSQDTWPPAQLRVPWRELQADARLHATLAQTNTFRRLVIAWQRANVEEVESLAAAIQTVNDN